MICNRQDYLHDLWAWVNSENASPLFRKQEKSFFPLFYYLFLSHRTIMLFFYVVLFAIWCAPSSVKILMGWVQICPGTHDCIAAAAELMEGKGVEARSLMSQGSHWTSLIKYRFKDNILVNFKTKTAKHWIPNTQGSVWLWWLYAYEVGPGSRKYLNFKDEDTLTTRKKVFFILFCFVASLSTIYLLKHTMAFTWNLADSS